MIRACHKVFFGQASVLVQDMEKKKKEKNPNQIFKKDAKEAADRVFTDISGFDWVDRKVDVY